jgi:hypothetical protein
VKPTVAKAISDRPVDEKGLVAWANAEVQPVLEQLRIGANARGIERQEGVTDGLGTFFQVWVSDPLPTDAAWILTASVAATTDAASGAQKACYLLVGFVVSTAGVVALNGQSVLFSSETDVACDVRFGVSDRSVYLEVRDEGTAPMRFASVVDVTESRRS